jgi:hypothetical protein
LQIGGLFLTRVQVFEVTPEEEVTSALSKLEPELRSALTIFRFGVVPASSKPFKDQTTRQLEVLVVTEKEFEAPAAAIRIEITSGSLADIKQSSPTFTVQLQVTESRPSETFAETSLTPFMLALAVKDP